METTNSWSGFFHTNILSSATHYVACCLWVGDPSINSTVLYSQLLAQYIELVPVGRIALYYLTNETFNL